MALDRFVRFREEKPSVEEVYELLLEFGVTKQQITTDGKWFFAYVPGWDEKNDCTRHFEVCCIHENSIDVMTRQADNYTNALALGFAIKLALRFNGWLDSDDYRNWEKIKRPEKELCIGCQGRGFWYSEDNGQRVDCLQCKDE